MADKFQYKNAELNSPGDIFYTITPNDQVEIPFRPRAVMIGTPGNLACVDSLGVTTVMVNLAVGIYHPIRPLKILATGTTAANIFGIC